MIRFDWKNPHPSVRFNQYKNREIGRAQFIPQVFIQVQVQLINNSREELMINWVSTIQICEIISCIYLALVDIINK